MNGTSTIRFRLTLLFCFALSGAMGLGYFAVNGWLQYTSMHESLNLTYALEAQVNDLNVYRFSEKTYKSLKKSRAQLKPEHREKALSDIIQAYADKSPRLLKKRTKFFLKNEVEYRSFARSKMAYWQDKILYFSVLSVGTLLSALLFAIFYINKSVFSPMQELSSKMNDFLHDKYTYQFSVPAPNEVGHLQATFNSLAQRVLANMDELTDLDRAKTEFLNIASHELRTPLTSIKGSLSLLQSGVAGELNESSQNLMNIAEIETDRLIRLINDVLDLAKIEAGRLPLEKDWTDLNQFSEEAVKSLDGLAQTAGVQLKTDALPKVLIDMDSDRIQQVLTNLISNAIKFSPQGGAVTVSAELLKDGMIKICVNDQGKGIAPEDIDRIFEKFSQASGPDNPLVKGTGLGLAIARAIVTEHGGDMGVQSAVGKGSQFYFTLPNWKMSEELVEDINYQSQGVAA